MFKIAALLAVITLSAGAIAAVSLTTAAKQPANPAARPAAPQQPPQQAARRGYVPNTPLPPGTVLAYANGGINSGWTYNDGTVPIKKWYKSWNQTTLLNGQVEPPGVIPPWFQLTNMYQQPDVGILIAANQAEADAVQPGLECMGTLISLPPR